MFSGGSSRTSLNNKSVETAVKQYQKVLPQNRDKKILDIGCEMGTFSAACIHLGYENIHCTDFGAKYKFQKIFKKCILMLKQKINLVI